MAGLEVTWLVLLPALLGCAVIITDVAIKALESALKPRMCMHTHRMLGRCVECGTPM